ncbi:MAG TPA: hypothetical protein VFV67_14515 [Actinophytocola sp.]|uniref:hypothetical protein n=1 Tax=Actinophytocola sp. TaxID=1872138 RepID=UPI002DB76D92|nr:hypothetical protein [Actinophytocola sp.]HEU5471861.1 hypothetical protein [Actinophytocola sp.]
MSVQEDVWNWLHPALQDLRSTADQSWAQRRARFLEQLGLPDPAEQPAVAALLHWLDELPDEERTTTLDSDQLDATAYELVVTQVAEPDAGTDYDEQAWHTFLATNGPSWDGSAESWPAFRQWFEYHAAEQGFGTVTTALLDFLESQPASERVATFASYGVTIATPTEQPAQAVSAGAEATAEEIPAELAEIMNMIDKLPSADQLDAELAGIPDAAEEEHAGLDELDELDVRT